MAILLDNAILYVTFGAAALWLLLRRWVEPRALRALVRSRLDLRPGRSAIVTAVSLIRSVSAAVALAGIVVIAGTLALRLRVSFLGDDEAALNVLVRLRGAIESSLDTLTRVSLGAWLASLAGLALLWLLVSATRTRRRWRSALEIRRAAIEARYAQATDDELRAAATEADAAAVARLDERIAGLVRSKAEAVAKMRSLPVLEIGQSGGVKASLQDLADAVAAMRQPSNSAEAQDADEPGEPSDEERAAVADQLEARLAQIAREIRFTLFTLDRPIEVSLAEAQDADDALVARPVSVRMALRRLVIDAELARQDELVAELPHSEPEFFHQWVAAFLTGEQVARLGGRIGSGARTALIVVLFIGLVGLGTRVQGPLVQGELMQIEIAIGQNLTDQQLAQVMAAVDQEEETASATELASDAETEAQLAQAMRSSVARALQAGRLGQSRVVLNRRASFDLATVEARQRILLASSRPAPAAAQFQSAVEYRPALPEAPGAYQSFDEILEDTIERRTARMRSNEAVWRRMRAAAARPAPPDLVTNQFLRAAFTGDQLPAPMAMRAWTERATLDVAQAAIRSGTIPHTHVPSVRIEAYHGIISIRDQGLIADFDARAPRNVATHIDGLNSGRIDPGSLHRASVNVPIRASGGSAYADLFPAVVQSVADVGGSGGGSGSDVGRAATTPKGGTASARSYSRIRFNRRVGGVVIGRLPEASEQAVEVTGFEWSLSNDQIELFLTTPATGRLSLGRFHPSIAHHALAYAADGRVVTSTLPQLLPIEDSGGHAVSMPARQVAVHPAFEDTAFACAAIEIDRFVDRTMYGDPNGATTLVEDRNAVSLFGRILELHEGYSAEQLAGALPDIADYVKNCGAGGTCFPVERYSRGGMNFTGVDALLDCIATASDPASACVPEVAILGNTAAYSVDSGVRELPYSLTPDLAFLRPDRHAADPLWPLDFIVQAVPVTLTESDLALPDTLEPWTFPAWGDDLRGLVELMVKGDPDADSVLQQMRQFTILQRLFRLALAGDLGIDFPLQALVAMQEATHPFVKPHRHEHWNISHAQPNPEFVDALRGEEADLAQALRTMAQNTENSQACRAAAERQLALYNAERWPEGPSFWPTLQQVASACAGQPDTVDFDRRFAALTRLDLVEEAVAIHNARGTPPASGCPPL